MEKEKTEKIDKANLKEDSELTKSARESKHREKMLDEALKETFPASDPIAVFNARKNDSNNDMPEH